MKKSLDDELNQSFQSLNQKLRMKREYHDHLKKRILLESKTAVKQKRINKKVVLSIALTALLLLISSPLYSTTMASLAAKIIPLEMKSNSSIIGKIFEVGEQSGYKPLHVKISYNPYTITIWLEKGEDSLAKIQGILEPEIKELLYNEGIDQYTLNFTQEDKEYKERQSESDTFDKMREIISTAFSTFGYSDWAEYASFGIGKDTLYLDMPMHVKEAEEIKSDVMKSIKNEKLKINEVKLEYIYSDVEDQRQRSRWEGITSDIHQALAGKSIYNVTNIFSLNVQRGVSYVSIQTGAGMSDPPDKQILSEIDSALRTFLDSDEVKKKIQDDQYEIRLLNKYDGTLLVVSNKE
ncbi:DUF4030 domain-containing protein [Bacillus spongiae]|uniref:DUF4030 domain-containing protein n=1 Tax=Bacillus spongiae TaxID=2683610 RepID=A0ABU8HH24_9BACI